MLQHTPLFELHRQAGAKFVDFFGWQMPIHYGSQIEEHHYVRQHAGLFDVSHMGVVDFHGEEVEHFLRYVLANDIHKLKNKGDALYSCMLNENGGVIDDLIVYFLDDNFYRMVINASRRDVDLSWLKKLSVAYKVDIRERDDLCIIAVQGPEAIPFVQQALKEEDAAKVQQLKPFTSFITDNCLIARTGYTGENGVEIILPPQQAIALWKKLTDLGVHPVGLGARDTLRLEAGLNLYGADMTEETSPLISNLAWTVSWQDEQRNFVGKKALELQKQQGINQQLVGLVMEQAGVLRNHQRVIIANNGEGEITSGSFSPTLGIAIALARVPVQINGDVHVDRRGKLIPVKIVKPPFVRFGKKIFELRENKNEPVSR